MLFNKKTKGVVKVVWTVLAFLIIISMVLLYAPIFLVTSHGGLG